MKKLFLLSGSALLLAAACFAGTDTETPAMTITTGAKSINATGIYATSGQQFSISVVSSGRANIDPDEGGYGTDSTGTITFAPVPSSGTYSFFTSSLNPIGTPPAVGGQKFGNSSYPAFSNTVPLGALLAAWSPNPTPTQESDFPYGFLLVGSGTTVTAPAAGGYLFLNVNDLIGFSSDNVGGFSVAIDGPLTSTVAH
jgi:hypothetical protein